jgi:D-aminopeptidase
MICHDFKGGIGTSSRQVSTVWGNYTVGALVQTNYGDRKQFAINGVPVGHEISLNIVPEPWQEPPRSSSIIIIVATDAPLLPVQCKRLAQRATSGLARVGGFGHNSSGDLFLAFATGNHIPEPATGIIRLEGMLPNDSMDHLFDAAVESVEESIINALTSAETMTGHLGHIAHAIPLDLLQQVMKRYRPG